MQEEEVIVHILDRYYFTNPNMVDYLNSLSTLSKPTELVDKLMLEFVDILDVQEKFYEITHKNISLGWLRIVVENLINDWLWESPYTQVDGKVYSIMEYFVPSVLTIDEVLNQ